MLLAVALSVTQSRNLPGAQDESPDESCDEPPDVSSDESHDELPDESCDHTGPSERRVCRSQWPVCRSHQKNAEKFLTGKETEKRGRKKENVQLKRSHAGS